MNLFFFMFLWDPLAKNCTQHQNNNKKKTQCSKLFNINYNLKEKCKGRNGKKLLNEIEEIQYKFYSLLYSKETKLKIDRSKSEKIKETEG